MRPNRLASDAPYEQKDRRRSERDHRNNICGLQRDRLPPESGTGARTAWGALRGRPNVVALNLKTGAVVRTGGEDSFDVGEGVLEDAVLRAFEIGPLPVVPELPEAREHRIEADPATSFCEYARHEAPQDADVVRAEPGSAALRLRRLVDALEGVRGPKSAPVEGDHGLLGFLTTEANAVVAPVHPKAMPVILTTPEEVHLWLMADGSKRARAAAAAGATRALAPVSTE